MHLQRNHSACNDNASFSSMTSNDASFEESEILAFSDGTDQNQLQAFQKHFAELYMFCREKHLLPVSVVRSIMSKVVGLFATFETAHFESQNPVTFVEIELLWENLQSEAYYYRSFCRSAGFVAPEKIQIHDFLYQYVPLTSILQQYLSHADVMSSISHRYGTNANVSSNCVHWSFVSENEFFKSNEDLLRLHLYCDEVEICNPLGANRTTYKLTCFYFLVGNIQTKFWSNLRNIHLLLVVQSNKVKKYGYDLILQPLVADLKMLEEEGVIVNASPGIKKSFSVAFLLYLLTV